MLGSSEAPNVVYINQSISADFTFTADDERLDMEPEQLQRNIRVLLKVFGKVNACRSSEVCLSLISTQPATTSTLLFLDVPDPHPTTAGGDLSNGAENGSVLYGTELLVYLRRQMRNERLPASLFPVAVVQVEERQAVHLLDWGAIDVIKTPFEPSRIRPLYSHIHELSNSIRRGEFLQTAGLTRLSSIFVQDAT